jgi:hypothetical protein
MAKQKSDVNKSEEIRKMLKANPNMPVKEIVADLAGRGLKVTTNLLFPQRQNKGASWPFAGKLARWSKK